MIHYSPASLKADFHFGGVHHHLTLVEAAARKWHRIQTSPFTCLCVFQQDVRQAITVTLPSSGTPPATRTVISIMSPATTLVAPVIWIEWFSQSLTSHPWLWSHFTIGKLNSHTNTTYSARNHAILLLNVLPGDRIHYA